MTPFFFNVFYFEFCEFYVLNDDFAFLHFSVLTVG